MKRFSNYFGSITARLTFLYSITTFLLLTFITVGLYTTTAHILRKANENFLSKEIDIISTLLTKNVHNSLALKQEIIEVPYIKTGSLYHYYIRLVNQNNKIFMATPLMAKRVKYPYFSSLPAKKIQSWHHKGEFFLLMQDKIELPSKQFITIQIALDITYQKSVLALCRNLLLLVLSVGTLIAIILGYLIARGGMRKLNELTEHTKQITISSLDQKIELDFWPEELRTLGLAFNKMLKRIQDGVTQITQFSADLAHELRTPINNLMGETELALSHCQSKTDYEEVLASNLEELQRVSQLIENILFLARAENPHVDLNKIWLNLHEEIALMCEYYGALAEDKNIDISIKGKGLLHANQVMFRRMVNNLLANAIKYTPTNGKIIISIKENGSYIDIKFQDTGIGIPSHHIPKIFNRFYRVDSARSNHSGGTGLGLPIVKSIVELHGGSIHLESIENQGSVFWIRLPKS